MTNDPNHHGGNYRTTREAMMATFDGLPPVAREALANSVEDWVPQPLLTRYRRGMLGQEIAKVIAGWDAQELTKRENQRARGIGVYKIGGRT